MTVLPEVALNPIDGVQLKLVAPEAESVILLPSQIFGEIGVTVIIGSTPTSTCKFAVFVQLLRSVPVIV